MGDETACRWQNVFVKKIGRTAFDDKEIIYVVFNKFK